ncbi:MAG: hypothetical protein KC442_12795 [Thermomicrobiales bacterium]|nr:hypothetical protein [Thermomicrobiales bacterium]
MDTQDFDTLTAVIAHGNIPSRRVILGGLLAGGLGLLSGTSMDARKKGQGKGKASRQHKKHGKKKRRCKNTQTRCGGTCVNTDVSNQHCGACGVACAAGEQCLHGRCYSPDICPAGFQACPDFQRCSVDDSDCFCGSTTGGQTVCFQDEDFCESPRPCVTTSDCDQGRVCLDSIGCCEARDMPAVNRTCVLPCANQAQKLAADQQAYVLKGGPGTA